MLSRDEICSRTGAWRREKSRLFELFECQTFIRSKAIHLPRGEQLARWSGVLDSERRLGFWNGYIGTQICCAHPNVVARTIRIRSQI